MKSLIKLTAVISAILTLYFAYKWYVTKDSSNEIIMGIFAAITVLASLFLGSDNDKPKNSAFIFGKKNKINQKNNSLNKHNNSTIFGSENELEQ